MILSSMILFSDSWTGSNDPTHERQIQNHRKDRIMQLLWFQGMAKITPADSGRPQIKTASPCGRLRVKRNDWLTPSRQDRKEGLKRLNRETEKPARSPFRFFNMILFSTSGPLRTIPLTKDKDRIIERTESAAPVASPESSNRIPNYPDRSRSRIFNKICPP
jgi:hypothetical protein